MKTEARLKFIGALAKLTSPDNPLGTADVLMGMLPMLSHIHERAFESRDCLHQVATAKRRTITPTYGDIETTMRVWLKEHPVAQEPLALGLEHLSADDMSWVRFYRKRESEGFAAMRPGDRRSSAEHVLSLIRQQAPRAWSALTGNVAGELGPPSQAERDAVRRIVAGLRMPQEPVSASRAVQLAAVRSVPVVAFPEPSAEVLRQREENAVIKAARSADDLFGGSGRGLE